MAVTQRALTLEEFLKLPEESPALEFQHGRVTQKVSPQGRHAWLQSNLAELINHVGRSQRLALGFSELRAVFADVAPVPDVSILRWERVRLTDSGEVADRQDPPDVAIEIVSPDQSVSALVEKCLFYVESGVEIALLIDPDDRVVLRFSAGGRTEALRGADRVDLSSVLPGFELTAQGVFDLLRLEAAETNG